jgi:hypothetical protein
MQRQHETQTPSEPRAVAYFDRPRRFRLRIQIAIPNNRSCPFQTITGCPAVLFPSPAVPVHRPRTPATVPFPKPRRSRLWSRTTNPPFLFSSDPFRGGRRFAPLEENRWPSQRRVGTAHESQDDAATWSEVGQAPRA